MYKCEIFSQKILIDDENTSLIQSFDGLNVEITDTYLKIFDEGDLIATSELEYVSNDPWTETYHGSFNSNLKFRVIRPIDLSLDQIKSSRNCFGAFSLASISPAGYAIHFLLK